MLTFRVQEGDIFLWRENDLSLSVCIALATNECVEMSDTCAILLRTGCIFEPSAGQRINDYIHTICIWVGHVVVHL